MLHDSTPKQCLFNRRYIAEVRKKGRKKEREGSKKEKKTRRGEEWLKPQKGKLSKNRIKRKIKQEVKKDKKTRESI